MNILLIKPPCGPSLSGVNAFVRDDKLLYLFEPLELEQVAGGVVNADIQILDMRIDPDLEGCLDKFRPDVVGTTCWTTGVYWAKKIMAMVKMFDRKILTVIGGQHATLSPGDFFEPYVDAIIIGPGEIPFKNIVEAFRKKKNFSGIGGLFFRNNGKFIDNGLGEPPKDFSVFPPARRDLTAKYKEHYQAFGDAPFPMVEISRGCAFNCNFCSIWKSFPAGYITKDPVAVVDEIESLEAEHLYFCDPNTTHDVKQINKILDLIEKRGIRKKYHINGRVNAIAKYPEMIDRWTELGLENILIGFESFKKTDLEDYEKRTSLDLNLKTIDVLKRNNIISLAQFIIRPDYDEKDFDSLLNFIIENDILAPVFTILTPLPGSDLYKEKSHLMTSKNYELFDLRHCLLPTKLPRKDFYKQYVKLHSEAFAFSRLVKRVPLYFTDLLLNHWKWRQRDITGAKEPWRSDVRTLGLVKALGFMAMGMKLLPEIEKGYEDELVPYPPIIEFR